MATRRTKPPEGPPEGGPILRPIRLADAEELGRHCDQLIDRIRCDDWPGARLAAEAVRNLALRLCRKPAD